MEEELQNILKKSLHIIRKYGWLLNSYVLDFFVEEHWTKLPPSGWRKCLNDVKPEQLSELLMNDRVTNNKCGLIWPLELCALRKVLDELCLNRQPVTIVELPDKVPTLVNHPKLKNLFNKSVKRKKRHEIEKMAAICKRSCLDTSVDFVIDFGAGLGHLARILGYGYGIRVCCLEMQSKLNEQARVIDSRLESLAAKHLSLLETANFQRPTHVTLCLSADMTSQEFLTTIRQSLGLPHENFRFGIIGLHPCGDLGVILMRMFLNCTQAKFLNYVGCCYMKLTTVNTQSNDTKQFGYPVSKFLRQQKTLSHLSYEAREISCHATEIYLDRLAGGNYEHLRVHSFRAAAERILRYHWPDLKHCGLNSVKHIPGMQFEDYFYKAVQGMKAADLPVAALSTAATKEDLLQWQQLVVFYTLRLMLAPLVESVILYDRILYLRENNCHVEVNPIFDPRISPRNHITSAYKVS